nr:uncharacterized protein LOC114927628 [Arachis hypogaea]
MVRADASVSIKVLLNATAAHFGFRPTYRRVWMVKQKSIALIYGDWDESYNDLPRWVLGVQLTMPGSLAVLKTSLVRVGGQDGNSNILPVAFALVEGENAESWRFFLSHLRQHVTPQPGLLVISNRHNGIKAALEAPDSDPAMCEWANRIDYSLWTQHRDEGRRFGHMMTNIFECVNSILKGRREAEAQMGTGQQFSQHLVKCIEANLKTARCFTVTLYDRDNSEFTVAKTTPTGSFSLGTYRVSLASRTCDCGYFQALHFPCQHALACCAYSRVTWTSYVHSVYQISSVFSVYRMGFTPSIPEGF